jgi:uncharacterized protein YndB with AHSA1/START domain
VVVESHRRRSRARRQTMASQEGSHDVVVTRTFDAPQEAVWRSWSEPDDVMTWWGPQGFTSPMCRMDFREGGTTLVCMRSAEGAELYNTWTYRSIEPMTRIEFVQGFADENGNRVAPIDLGLPPAIPHEVPHVVTLRAIDDATTELTVHEFGYPNEQIVEVSRTGMEQCLERMATSLAGG